MTYLKLRVTPKSRADEVCGWQGDSLKVKVKAPPERGQANEALLRLLSVQLATPLSSIRLVVGASSRNKVVQIEGLEEGELRQRLGLLL